MKEIFKVLVILWVSICLIGCSSGQNYTSSTTSQTDVCNLAIYKSSAKLVMDKFSKIIENTDISDKKSREDASLQLQSLKNDANSVKCKDSFPLKQETLEYSIRHLLSALYYIDQGNIEEGNVSLEKSRFNVEMFMDWTVDVVIINPIE